MKKKLYLMRHGETLFNVLGKVQGACDSPLTEKGIEQAQHARNYFVKNNIQFDHVYASTQERACDTLEVVTNNEMSYTRLKGLKEMNFGRFEGESSELQQKGPENFETFYVPFGGEAACTVQKRMSDTLAEIMKKEDHEKVLAVSHNGACFYFLRTIWNKENKEIPVHFPNCAIFEFDYEAGGFNLTSIIDPHTQQAIL